MSDRVSTYGGVHNLEAMESAHRYHAFLTAAALAQANPDRPVLDFGAGTGTHARGLRDSGLDVRCVEPDIELRKQLEGDGFEVAAAAGDYGPKAFGTIYSFNVLEHIEDDRGAIQALFAALKPGGRLVLYVPAFPLLFSHMDYRVGHYRRYRKVSLQTLAAAAGFRVGDCRYVDSLGFFAALGYRLLRGSGDLSERSVALYDRFGFPLSRKVDLVTSRWFGKNLLMVAVRD